MTPAGWYPDPRGTAGQLRWWDGQVWTEHVHPPAPAPPPSVSPLDASVLEFGPPQLVAPGCRVFELTDGAATPLGRLVETTRGANDSTLGATLSRSRGFQHGVTRELRGPSGYPELLLTWGPASPGAIVVTLADRREVGRLLLGENGWAVVSYDGRPWATATAGGVVAADGSHLSVFTPDGIGGWRAASLGGPAVEPVRSLVGAAAAVADLL